MYFFSVSFLSTKQQNTIAPCVTYLRFTNVKNGGIKKNFFFFVFMSPGNFKLVRRPLITNTRRRHWSYEIYFGRKSHNEYTHGDYCSSPRDFF